MPAVNRQPFPPRETRIADIQESADMRNENTKHRNIFNRTRDERIKW